MKYTRDLSSYGVTLTTQLLVIKEFTRYTETPRKLEVTLKGGIKIFIQKKYILKASRIAIGGRILTSISAGLRIIQRINKEIDIKVSRALRNTEPHVIEKSTESYIHYRIDNFYDKHADKILPARTRISLEDVVSIVAHEFNITPEKLRSKTNKKDVVLPRQIAHYFARKYVKDKQLNPIIYRLIAGHIGNKDHATVINSIKAVENYIDTDSEFKFLINDIDNKINRLIESIDKPITAYG